LHGHEVVSVVGGRYETFERIGGGGMADVFRAHDRTLDRDVAIKVMRPAFAQNPEFAERFHREADALGAIDHPNIVRVLDYGTSADGPYIVMELVGGGTLRDLMRARGRLDQYAASKIAAEIADGLEAAHLRGVLHRDLKPDNVLLDAEGRPKIADFGIARLAAATAITRTGEILGTPQYLAPEQMTGDVVDERADVYALGVILYEMLTGTQPTGGTTPSEIVSRRLRVDPRPPSRLVAIAPAVNVLVMRTLARDPSRRFRRAADLRGALLAIKPPTPPVPARVRTVRLPALSLAPLATAVGLLGASIEAGAHGFRRAARRRADELRAGMLAIRPPTPPALPRPRVGRVRLPSLAPLRAALALFAVSIRDRTREFGRRPVLLASMPGIPPATARARIAPSRRRTAAPLLAALALLAAFIGGTFVFAGARPVARAPAAGASATPAVLASTSSPAVTAAPTVSPEPIAEPSPEPTPAPTLAPTPAPAISVTAAGDPAVTIVSFYELVSGHDYASASGLWSDRMRAAYPPQTNIWGRFDATSSIVARSASVTSAGPGSAAVAVDLIETLRNGAVRRWVGTWYLVRSGSGWLLDQPGLRPA
jgi:protein kinase-like protein